MFKFKQFSVDQSGCAMKINTDGVLLAALCEADNPCTILDIGTGTGVIALMLAQKFSSAIIDAVEIDDTAAQTATSNFENSPFANRLSVFSTGFEPYFDQHPEKKYDLIVSNPPFFINSLKSLGTKKALAKHTDNDFFEKIISNVSLQLTPAGCCWLILPVTIADQIIALAASFAIYPFNIINVHSYPHSRAHRVIIRFGFNRVSPEIAKLTIYKAVGVYSDEYQKLLQPYFIAF